MPSLPLPLVHLVSLRSLLGRLGKTGVGTSHKPADISSLAINTNIVGRGPARHTRLISPVALPRPLRHPALAPGSSLLRVADTFTYFSQEPVSAAAMVRNPRPAAAHHLDCHVITATQCEPSTMGYPLLGPKQTCAGHPGIFVARVAALDGYGLYGGDISTAAATRATGTVPNTNTTTRNSVSLPIG